MSISDSRPATGHWQLSAVEIPADPAAAAAANAASVITYAYDKQGNRTSATPGAGAAVTMTYDQANRLVNHQTGTSPPSVAPARIAGKGTAALRCLLLRDASQKGVAAGKPHRRPV